MLVEIAIFDAYGAGFEYARPSGHRQNDLRCYYSHPRHKQPPGNYTDDTEMSIAIAELLIEGQNWTPQNIADKFVHVFKRNGERPGYAGGFYSLLQSVKDGAELLAKILPQSTKSGAAMRSVPLGWIEDSSELMEKCEIQARVTHDTGEAMAASQAIALATRYVRLQLGPKAGLPTYIEEVIWGRQFGWDFRETQTNKIGEQGLESARAAIQAVALPANFMMSELLRYCVELGGDVDTVCAMAGGIASMSKEIIQDVPTALENLLLTLENGDYGKDYLAKLDNALEEKYGAK